MSLYANEKTLSFTWAFFLSTIFFSPYLFTSNPHFKFFGDVAILYFPQFVEGYHMAKSGALSGIDFLTSNGSTAYFLRPNIPAYYPPYQLTYALFHFESIEGLARAFVFILYAHTTLAAYYCIRIGRKYLQMDHATSILFSVLYFGGIANCAFTAPPFFYVAALFPFLIYFAIQSTGENTWWHIPLYSFCYVMVFLSGYPPLAVNAVLLVLLIAVGYVWQNKNIIEFKSLGRHLLRCFAPPVLAGLVVISLYMAMVLYHKQVTGVADGVWHSAHQFSFESRDIFALLSRAFPASNPGTGTPFVQLGLVPALLLVLAFSQRKKLVIMPHDAKIIALSVLIFSFYLLLAFGQASGLPDMFYFVIPVIGKMHFYGRHLLVASFFFYLAVAISFKYLLQIRTDLPIGRWLVGISAVMALVQAFAHFGLGQPESLLRPQLLVIELLMLGLVLISLSTKQGFYPFIGVIGIAFLIHAANFNSYINSFSQVAVGPYKNEVAFFPERRELLISYFKKNSNKILIKYADITVGIEKPSGVMLNSTWLLRDKLKISNYMGYEPHLAVDRDYMAESPYPYYGKINIPWVLRTGADFIIYNQASWAIHSAELEQWIDKNVPELDLWYGYKVAKLKNVAGQIDGTPAQTTWDFDNGIVRISSAEGATLVTNFETDFVSSVHFNVESSSPVTVRYALFPNKMMELRVDGKRSDVTLKSGLLEFILPPGRHFVEYEYKNILHEIFVFVYLFYISSLIGILCMGAWLGLRSFHKKTS